MNQDITAPATLQGRRLRNSLSDATAEVALYEHSRAVLHGFWQSELAALSRGSYLSDRADMATLRNMQSVVSAAVSGFHDAFAKSRTNKPVQANFSIDVSTPTVLERFTRALGEWRGLLAPDHFDRMAQHVNRLLSDEEEIDEENTVPSPSSFDDMLAFLSGRPWDKAPTVGLNRRGQFSMSWGKSHPQVDVTLTFLGEGSVKWYVYGLGRRATGSAAGTSDRADVTTILSRLGCDEWMAR